MTTDNNAPADDVVARLRNMIADFDDEVADVLLSDSGERSDLWDEIDVPVSVARGVLARIRELEDGLRPFAAVAEHDIGESEADEDRYRPMERHNRAPIPTVGDFRRARALIERNSK